MEQLSVLELRGLLNRWGKNRAVCEEQRIVTNHEFIIFINVFYYENIGPLGW